MQIVNTAARSDAAAAAMIEGFIMRFICRRWKAIGQSLSTALNQRRAIKAARLINLAFRVRILMGNNARIGSRPAINSVFKYAASLEALKRDEKLRNEFKGVGVKGGRGGGKRRLPAKGVPQTSFVP